jgi:hypothetical protein
MSDTAAASSEVQLAAPDIFELELHFNLFPATYAHPSWIERLGFCEFMSDRADLPTSSTHWIRTVSDALLTERGLEQQFDFDFSSPRKRIALLDAGIAVAVATYVAAILLRDQLRTVIARAAVAEIRAKIGADAHRFALQFNDRVPVLSEVSQRLAACPLEQWEPLMATLILTCLPEGALGVIGRMQLRFPCAWSEIQEEFRLQESERVLLGQLFVAVACRMPITESWLFDLKPLRPGEQPSGVRP